MKIYKSCLEYCLENGVPSQVFFEYWFIKREPDKIYTLPLAIRDVILKRRVIIRGICDLTAHLDDNTFVITPVGYHKCEIKENGFIFAVMLTEAGMWKTQEYDILIQTGDSITLNPHLRPKAASKKQNIWRKLFRRYLW